MPDEMEQMLKDAIANTETEIFSEAVGKDLPGSVTGDVDRSVEEMGEGLEGQHEADEGDDQHQAQDGTGDEPGEGDGKAGGEGQERDPETGQFKAKGEGEQAKPGEQQQTEQQQTQQNPKANVRVPLAELERERKSRQELEKQLADERTAREQEKTQSRSEFERLNARLDQILATPPQQRQTTTAQQDPAQDGPKVSDLLFEDPERFIANLEQQFDQKLTQRFLAADFNRAHKVHGEKFNAAYTALTSLPKNDPAARATVQKIYTSATPSDDLLEWHAGEQARAEIAKAGGLDKMRETLATQAREQLANDPEFRKQLLEQIKAEASGTGTGNGPRVTTKLPRSLNGAAGGAGDAGNGNAARSADNSDRGVFEDAFRG